MQTSLRARLSGRADLLMILCAAMLWGTVGVTTRTLYETSAANPLSVGFFRLAIATPALLIACWLTLGRRAWRVAPRDLGLMVLIGAMLALYQVCYFFAIARVGVAVATLVTLCTAPVIVALLGTALGRERMTRTLALVLALALGGTALLIDLRAILARPADLLGIGLALGSALGYAVVTLVGRSLGGRYPSIQTTAISFASGALVLLPLALATGFVAHYAADGWLRLLYLGLIPSALAYALFFRGVRGVSATATTILTLIEPLTATALAWLLFHERLGASGAIGAALLLGAVLLLGLRGEDERREQSGAPERT